MGKWQEEGRTGKEWGEAGWSWIWPSGAPRASIVVRTAARLRNKVKLPSLRNVLQCRQHGSKLLHICGQEEA